MDASNVESLLRGGCLLQLPEVVEACCGFLTTQLDPSNCLGIRQFADVQNCPDLYRNANQYAQVNIVIITCVDEWRLLLASLYGSNGDGRVYDADRA